MVRLENLKVACVELREREMVRLEDLKVAYVELREMTGFEDIVTVLSCHMLRRFGHVLKRTTVSELKNVQIMWVKVLSHEVDNREHGRKWLT